MLIENVTDWSDFLPSRARVTQRIDLRFGSNRCVAVESPFL